MKELHERRPRGGWTALPVQSAFTRDSQFTQTSRWQKGSIVVLSSLEHAELPGSGGLAGPTWHISVSRYGKRPTPKDVGRALRDFGMVGADEDNHHPGVARHYFMPIDPAYRSACECKTTEDVIVEKDGFAWTNPKPETGLGCRGCEYELLYGKPCPLHRQAARP